MTLVLSVASIYTVIAQGSLMDEKNFKGLKLRNIGPAFTSGRIADIDIHPDDKSVWYVAVGSGGVWKTTNSGITWNPIFDDQVSYSIGCVTIDPNNTHTIWVGTGENVGGRHVGYGDGIYKSEDDGKTWKNMGLANSEHISEIIVHPSNSNVIWVAVQGPLWTKGGERGVYKSTDGGGSWKKVLGGNEWTGATDLKMDPRNPDVLYAATWQRHRTVAAYLGGGPGSGIHRSLDGGETWQKLTSGIPKSNLGKIGLAISPQNPDVVYAAIELDRTTGGVFMSTNMGMTWTKQSNAVAGATGPHYYQELYASPHREGQLFLVNNSMLWSQDHGKTFTFMPREGMHSDSHSVSFVDDDPNYILVGTDGGIYETYDHTDNWRFIDNMPITQYYKVAVDDSKPFYWVYGGTQDNGSHGGPSRTDTEHGIRNADWEKTLGADGHQSATEPGNPNITYAETQQGGLHRIDRTTGEQVFIQPQAGKGEDYERFNWDAPIIVSPHDPATIYVASQRVWKSTNRGDSWEAISGDLTRNEERIALPIMGGSQSWDNSWDVGAMSNYNTITSLSESPVQQGLVYAGTDDGIIQVSEDDGGSWRKIEVGSIKGVPGTSFINDIRADLFDANTVYVCLDNHKYGDYKPYILKSTDKGQTWSSISGNIPGRTLIWRIVQDHVDSKLLFAATEWGIYFSNNGGNRWAKLSGGVPTIPFRDITIHRTESDLIGASFGRSFYILDDISPLRNLTGSLMSAEATLFQPEDALWYVERSIVSSQGKAKYFAENPPFGAIFTYFLSSELKTLKDQRQEKEKNLGYGNIPFPGWDALDAESRQEKPRMVLTVKDTEGNVVNTVDGPMKVGFNRINWDLRYASRDGVELSDSEVGKGFMAPPGEYTVTLSKIVDGVQTNLSDPIAFQVVPLYEGALPRKSAAEVAAFRSKVENFRQDLTSVTTELENSMTRVDAMRIALGRATQESPELLKRIYDAKQQLLDLNKSLNGSKSKGEIGEKGEATPRNRMFVGFRSFRTTYGPTPNHEATVDAGIEELAEIKASLVEMVDTILPSIENDLMSVGAPWIEGQGMK